MSHDGAGDLPPPPANKKSPAEEEEAEKRRKKLTPGSLMKAVIRSGGGDATPAERDQVVHNVCMVSLHLVHMKLLAADLLSLTVRRTSPPSFARCGRTVARVELVGVVVSRDRKEKFLRFLVDDGTDCVPCVLWLNHQYLNVSSSSGTSDSDPTAEMALKMSEVVSLGILLRVRGRIVMYRGAIQIVVRDVVLEKDPNAELLHWLQYVSLAKQRYDLPPPSA